MCMIEIVGQGTISLVGRIMCLCVYAITLLSMFMDLRNCMSLCSIYYVDKLCLWTYGIVCHYVLFIMLIDYCLQIYEIESRDAIVYVCTLSVCLCL